MFTIIVLIKSIRIITREFRFVKPLRYPLLGIVLDNCVGKMCVVALPHVAPINPDRFCVICILAPFNQHLSPIVDSILIESFRHPCNSIDTQDQVSIATW
jgi:hypothetical protein